MTNSITRYQEPQIDADECGFVNRASALICVHLRFLIYKSQKSEYNRNMVLRKIYIN